MSDRRLIPANGRVAAVHLLGKVDADRHVQGVERQICVKSTNLWSEPAREKLMRQLIYGDLFVVYEMIDGMAFGQASKDGYVGYIAESHLQDPVVASHFVSVRSAHIYPLADLKSVPVRSVSFGSRLQVIGQSGEFFQTGPQNFVFRDHLRDLGDQYSDPADVAELFLGTPYLWGGNSCDGIDCSGLVQVSLLTCGIACPGDSDLQQETVGTVVGHNVPVQRGDLYFWRGHVAMAVDADRLIHATANSMSVVHEDIETVIARIAEQGAGPVLCRKRPR